MSKAIRNSFVGVALLAILMISIGASVGVPVAHAQGARAQAPSNQPFDPKDFNGLWGGQNWSGPNRTLTKDEPPMNAAGLAFYHAQKTEFSKPPVDGEDNTDPVFRCEPGSSPRTYALGHPIQIVQTPSLLLMLLEAYRNFRIVYLDGRKQPTDAPGTWYGDSVGSWDGNSMVVDTVNFNGRNWLDDVGHPESEKMHIVEKLTRVDHGHLRMDITVDDPTYYTQPFSGTLNWRLNPPDRQLEDYMCSPADEAKMNELVRYKADPATPKK